MAWWHWLVLGFTLAIFELAIPAFFIIWFGLAALAVGLLTAVVPSLSLTSQIVSWAILSIIFVVLWFRIFKPKTATRSGTAESVVGEVGLLIRDVQPFQPGQVRFQRPLLGSDLWECVAENQITSGARVRVLSVEGRVVKIAAV